MTPKEYKIKHVGWLLAADAPVNIAKGEKLLPTLSEADQADALAYRNECRKVYRHRERALSELDR